MMLGREKMGGIEGCVFHNSEHGYCQTEIKEVKYLHLVVWFCFASEKVIRGDCVSDNESCF